MRPRTTKTLEMITDGDGGSPVALLVDGTPHAVRRILGRWTQHGLDAHTQHADTATVETWRVTTADATWQITRTGERWHVERVWTAAS